MYFTHLIIEKFHWDKIDKKLIMNPPLTHTCLMKIEVKIDLCLIQIQILVQ